MGSLDQKPVARLVAVTPEARAALGGKSDVRITRFPFNVGRESRLMTPLARLKAEVDRRLGRVPPLNDLYLFEPQSFQLHISREHFAIELFDAHYVVVDRGSACGTMVGRRPIGVNAAITDTGLNDGDLIVVGSAASPYVFRFELSER